MQQGFPKREWPKARVIDENCIGSGCELCINVCPFDALFLNTSGDRVGDFFGVAEVIEKRCLAAGCVSNHVAGPQFTLILLRKRSRSGYTNRLS